MSSLELGGFISPPYVVMGFMGKRLLDRSEFASVYKAQLGEESYAMKIVMVSGVMENEII